MIRLLYLTDTHITGSGPRTRTDSFLETLRRKLREAVGIAVARGVTAILHGGDLFDLPVPAFPVVSDCMRILLSPGLPFYAVAGNHDLYAHSPATLDRTMVGLLHNLGLIRLLQPGERVYLSEGGLRVQLSGTHFHPAIDRRDPTLDYCVEKTDAGYAVHMAHGMLLDSPLFAGTPHTLIREVAPFTGADVTLGSHAHFGYPEVDIGGKVFINPGALVRFSTRAADIGRTPQVVILEFDAAGFRFEYVPLRTALPGPRVINPAAALNPMGKTAGAAEPPFTGLRGVVDNLCREHAISDSVRDEALRLIAKHSKDAE